MQLWKGSMLNLDLSNAFDVLRTQNALTELILGRTCSAAQYWVDDSLNAAYHRWNSSATGNPTLDFYQCHFYTNFEDRFNPSKVDASSSPKKILIGEVQVTRQSPKKAFAVRHRPCIGTLHYTIIFKCCSSSSQQFTVAQMHRGNDSRHRQHPHVARLCMTGVRYQLAPAACASI